MHGGRAVMLESAPARPGGGAPRRRGRLVASLSVLVIAAAIPWAVPQVATSLASVADAIVPGGPGGTEVVPAAAGLPAVPVPETPVEADASGTPGMVGVPRELAVPALGVRTPVEPISGRTGELTPPADPRLVGWWREGARPGAVAGSAVLIGHTVSTGGGVFDELGSLEPGDRVRVRSAERWIGYAVTSTRTYSVAELARSAPAVFARSGPSRLVLVTCTDFDGEVYRGRTVVVASPLSRAAGNPG